MRSQHPTTADEIDFFHVLCDGHCDRKAQSRNIARGKAKVKRTSTRRDRREFRASRNTAKFLVNA